MQTDLTVKPYSSTDSYEVEFRASFDDEVRVVMFNAPTPDDVQYVVSALSAFHSGDDCECRINGEIAVLEGDWGLL